MATCKDLPPEIFEIILKWIANNDIWTYRQVTQALAALMRTCRSFKQNNICTPDTNAPIETHCPDNIASREDRALKFDNLAGLLALNGLGGIEMALHVENATPILPRLVMNRLGLSGQWLNTGFASSVLFEQVVDYDVRDEGCEKSVEEEEAELRVSTEMFEITEDGGNADMSDLPGDEADPNVFDVLGDEVECP
ncbi:uncharacterized protein M421DRAFT_4439 [Didymella exigua CBS 183.55]|uniref:F-box domain-containing protein n=1 Tax=Didymella exigua CBS 183.55 TaxID=1150837 RepID=A0A6A5RQ36_9PLEO|nr:uncharacterized protein M421DRAFT_4439 [Didymella exigua CBS 183.55]KAF1929278.1 hypothetical protein M421DRAFT_4439 [Didymella exigua CBS 183.55]